MWSYAYEGLEGLEATLYIHHDVRRIIRVDGKGASLALCIAWVIIIFEHWNLILDGHAHMTVLDGRCKYAHGLSMA